MKKSGIFKWGGYGLIVAVLAGASVFLFRSNIFSSRVVLHNVTQEERVVLHSIEGEHACHCFSPMISYFKVLNVTSTSASFTWDCSQQSTYQVNYGLTANKGTLFPANAPTSSYTLDTITVTGLTPNTLYHAGPSSICKASTCKGEGNQNESDTLQKRWLGTDRSRSDWTFTTSPAGGTYSIAGSILTGTSTPISGVTVTLSGTSSGTVTTTTNGQYQFSNLATGNYTVKPTKTNYTFTPANKTYANLAVNQTGQNFAGTPASAVLNQEVVSAITEVAAAKITAKDVTITWKTNVLATSLVEYGLTTNYGSKSGMNAEMAFDHYIQLFELKPGATYHARVVSNADDSKGTVYRSSDFTFKTPSFEDRIVNQRFIFNEPNPCATWTNFNYMVYQPLKSVTIDISTLSGKRVASLESPQSALAEGWNQVRWDVRDNAGQLLKNGLYVYMIKFRTLGNVEMEVKSSNLRIAR